MEREGSGGSAGLLQQILSLKLVPRVGNGTLCPNSTSLCSFPEMWYGVFLWALVSSLFFHVPAGLLALFTLRHHKYATAGAAASLLDRRCRRVPLGVRRPRELGPPRRLLSTLQLAPALCRPRL
ncbi:transmembrane protein 170A isoform X2 [Saimiri boliviensis]|uniref:transmembrane protein 170A isoform X2 n=1 Tax=Saimiri boliviensis TaxID=27679 RepID=UPI003D76E27C